MDRRKFIKVAGTQAGVLLGAGAYGAGSASASPAPGLRPAPGRRSPEIVVIGAGAFGGWTAYHLQAMGHQVTLVDLYGPGNSRSTSGDETRGIRTGYGDNELWTRWAKLAIERWKEWDDAWGTRMFTTTSDVTMRAEWDPFLAATKEMWDRVGVRHEVIDFDEASYRFPQMELEGFTTGLFEHDAGVGRSRDACLTVARQFERLGGEVMVAKAEPGHSTGRQLDELRLTPGESLSAQIYVFAVGPWFPKLMPKLMEERIRIPLGHVFYFGAPPGDLRFSHPHMPSFNFPGVTGWPILDHDSRGFRVRTGGRPPEDPDLSVRWIAEEYHESARRLLRERFPALADAPILETRACHYETSVSRQFIIDRHPDLDNVWIAGGGSAEGYKFGPVVGPYVASRVTGRETDPALAETFRMPEIP